VTTVQVRLTRSQAPSGLDKVLLPGEKLVLAVHQHWATLIEPVASTLLALALAIWVDSNVTKASEALGTICWWIFLAVLARLIWVSLDYNNHWFIATDKRLLLRYGIITRQVGMMPLLKVTDMRYVRSPLGRILGYGRFVLESAGQDQALREIQWVPKPDDTYAKICAEIFHVIPPPGDEDYEELVEEVPDEEFTARGGPITDTGPFIGGPPGFPDVHGTHDPIQERLDSYSRAVPVQRGPVMHRPRHEVVYESEDILRRRRSADTGPIWPPGDASDD
jgi:membrane protein YdbS with pleckstrin-like domain